MSRPPLEPIPVKPQPDLFTALLAISLMAVLVGTIIILLQARTLFPDAPLWTN